MAPPDPISDKEEEDEEEGLSQSENPARRTGGKFTKKRLAWLVAALAIFLTSTAYFCFLQKQDDLERFNKPASWAAWLVSPLEKNPLLTLPNVPDLSLNAVCFIDEKRGWVVGDDRTLLQTTNGGVTWVAGSIGSQDRLVETSRPGTDQNEGAKQSGPIGKAAGARPAGADSNKLCSVSFDSTGTYGLAGFGSDQAILITTNGGQSWDGTRFADLGWVRSVSAASPTNLWVSGETGYYRSMDGGASWEKPAFTVRPGKVRFVDPARGWMVTEGVCWRTENGGESWEVAGRFPGTEYSTLCTVGTDLCFVTTVSGVLCQFRAGQPGKDWTDTTPMNFEGHTNASGPFTIAFKNEKVGWCLMPSDPFLWKTTDGGKSFHQDILHGYPTTGQNQLGFDPRGNGWVVGAQGRIRKNLSGSAPWRRTSISSRWAFSKFGFQDTKNGLALDEDSRLFQSSNGGKSWKPIQGPWTTNETVIDIQPSESLVLVQADLYKTTLWRYSRSGQRWELGLKEPALEEFGRNPGSLHATARFEQRNPPELFVSDDHGQHWTDLGYDLHVDGETALVEELTDISIQKNQGWALWDARGESPKLIRSMDGGKKWTSILKVSTNHFFQRLVVDGSEVLLIGSDKTQSVPNVTLFSSDAGKTWATNFLSGEPQWSHARFIKPRLGWSLDPRGVIYTIRDGAVSRPQYTNAALAGGTLFALDEKHVWASGMRRAVFATADGGEHWEQLTHYSWFPAPMYFLCILLSGLCVFRAGKVVPEELKLEEESIANYPVSDGPLAGDSTTQDVLGFGELASGIANYLVNPNTRGPLTLAVQGEWGSGKSSLMNLLRERLAKQGMATVWFNAWHQDQGEEDKLLAALLARIKEEAPPRLLREGGLKFRFRLMLRRLWKRKILAVFLLSLTVALACWTWRVWDSLETKSIAEFIKRFSGFVPQETSRGKSEGGDGIVSFLISLLPLGGLAPLVYFVLRLMSAFNVDPAKILSNTSEKTVKDKASLNARANFQEELREVMETLDPRILIVFVDDLDRCGPAQIMAALQAINFLATAGECYIVLGMQEQTVMEGIIYSFQWREKLPRPTNQPLAPDAEWKFAQNWLEKMIQIRVSVPTLTEPQAQAFLELRRKTESEQQTETPPAPATRWQAAARALKSLPARLSLRRWQERGHGVVRFFAEAIPVLALLGLLSFAGWKFGHWLPLRVDARTPEKAADAKTNVLATNYHLLGLKWSLTNLEVRVASHPAIETIATPTPAKKEESAARDAAGAAKENSKTVSSTSERVTGALLPPEPADRRFGIPGSLLAIALLIACAFALLLEPKVTINDSQAFKLALREWEKVIRAYHSTPRSLKRLINRLRFRAMLMRDPNDPESKSLVPEEHIVAYGVLESVCPDLIAKRETISPLEIEARLKEKTTNEPLLPALALKGSDAIEQMRLGEGGRLQELSKSVKQDGPMKA